MRIYTFCLAQAPISRSLQALIKPPMSSNVPGLVHAECMTKMRLGAPIFSPDRMRLGQLAMFAVWEDQESIDTFLKEHRLGQTFARGWHVRMSFLRRWGNVSEFDGLPEVAEETDPESPVVAVTLARMKLPQVPRFIRWGRPVEEQVRDAPGVRLALAAIRLPRTVSTFTIWNSQREMVEMVRGHSNMDRPQRHANAMKERNRKDFHFEFTTLRFAPISEHGSWNGERFLPHLAQPF